MPATPKEILNILGRKTTEKCVSGRICQITTLERLRRRERERERERVEERREGQMSVQAGIDIYSCRHHLHLHLQTKLLCNSAFLPANARTSAHFHIHSNYCNHAIAQHSTASLIRPSTNYTQVLAEPK